jgi:hypothetical protein
MSALGNRIATYLADMEARKPDGRTFHAMHPEVLLREAMEALQRTEDAADKLRQERDEAVELTGAVEGALKHCRLQSLSARQQVLEEAASDAREVGNIANMLWNDNVDAGDNLVRREVAFDIERRIRARALAQEAGT